jgi:acetyl-CoA carboxylase biotin carboxylase subunit
VSVHGKESEEGLDVMLSALREFTIEGITTTIPFHRQLLSHPVFRSGDYHLDFLEKYMGEDGNLIVPAG